jgi:glutamate-1-semialdehyde 2,1-aminomutase
VREALGAQANRSPHYGAPHPEEVDLAEKIVKCIPCAEVVMLCNSGNEAVHKSITIARSYTGKDKVAKFEGCFHGSNEYSMWSVLLVEEFVGPMERPIKVPMCAGMPKRAEEDLVLLPVGEDAAFDLIEENASELAVVMLEPVMGPGALAFDKGFLEKLKETTRRNGVLLMFDEVITGFRMALGGAQERFGVIPDMAIFGKAMAGGAPIGAICTSHEIMNKCLDLWPPLHIAGTWNGNAMTVASANANLDYLMAHSPGLYKDLDAKGEHLRSGFNDFAEAKGFPASATGVGSMFQIHMMSPAPVKPRDRLREDEQVLDEFALKLRLEGIFLPYPLHIGFLSPAHGEEEIEEILRALKTTLVSCFEGRGRNG